MDAEPGKKKNARTIVTELLQVTIAIRELYKDRARWEAELLACQDLAPGLLAGKILEFNGYKITLEMLAQDKATVGERRSLPKAADGNLIKIKITGGKKNV